MDALVIEGKKKSDYDVIILMAKKLGLKVHFVKESATKTLSAETIKSLKDIEAGKVYKSKNHKDLMEQLSK
jgi:hypothetical protein